MEREAKAYDAEAVARHKNEKESAHHAGCPGSQFRQFDREQPREEAHVRAQASQLRQWPYQIKLILVNAPYFDGANLLIAADCTAYAYVNVHQKFMRGRITVIGCPKLDGVDYSEKLIQILENNNIRCLTIVRVEVPCCGGLETAVRNALQRSGKFIP